MGNDANSIIDVPFATSLATEHITVGRQRVLGASRVTTTTHTKAAIVNTNGKNSRETAIHQQATITIIKSKQMGKTIN